ncbi:hypothetical protein [Spirosoma agri]|uniref:Glycosyltransferase RgtA/B/C/D-like domain-containing protein n=1 Tax=Spirosoma agri TaxID=1987381 RepID=A0A6M0IJG4_9BACT|nr:hypothetical protein [Spirosoma agri]NEU68446.1 hypothetical protein [Spirosoma agri]
MTLSEKHLRIFLAILVLLTTLTYYHRNPTGDDAWFAEQSYWFVKDGIIRSEFFRGLLGWENQLLVSHKLFLLFGAGLINLFGYHLPVVQFVGLLSFGVIIAEIIAYIRNKEGRYGSWSFLAILILIFSNRLLIKMSFENRPELMLAALGFGSFLCLNNKRPSLAGSLIAGVLAGLAMLCHLNGVIYLIAGFGTLVYLRLYKQALLFAVAGGLTALFYFTDIVLADNGFAIWSYQFRNDPATQSAFGWYPKLIVILTFPKLFFESPEQIALSLLLVFLLWHQRKYLRALPVVLKVYSSLLIVSFWLITKHGSGTYMPLFIPFMLVLVYELYRSNPFKNWGLAVVLAAYFGIGIYGTIEIIYKNFSSEFLPVSYKNLREKIPTNEKGLVPLTYFFNEYDRHPALLSSENFKHHAIPTANPSAQLAQWAHQQGVGFILMDYAYRPEDFYPKPGTSSLPSYRLTYFDGRFAVYRHSGNTAH